MASSYTLATIVEKITNIDADLRIVATADLHKGLASGSLRLDGDQERKICSVLLQRLETDSSKPVQENCNTCIKHLVPKISETNAEELASRMITSVTSGKADRRAVFSLALKVLIAETPEGSCAQRITRSLIPRLISGMSEGSTDVVSECMDLAKDLSQRFGPMFAKEHRAFLDVLQPHLMSSQAAARRRAKEVIGFLAPSLSNALFTQLMEFLISNVDQGSARIEQQRTAIQAIGSVARQCGPRVGPFMDRLVPQLTGILAALQQIEDQEDPVFELMENIIQVFDAFVVRCPREADKHLAVIQDTALQLLRYNPFCESDDDEDDEDEEEEEEEEDEEWDDDDFDEDTSYKVRRASAKCVKSIASSRSDRLEQLYENVSDALINRFKEPLEPVKLEVFNAFIALVKQTKLVTNMGSGDSAGESSMDVDAGAGAEDSESGASAALLALVPRVVRILAKDLNNKKQKKIKTKLGAIKVMSQVLAVLPAALSAEGASQMITGLLRCLVAPTSTTLKLEALLLLWTILKGHENAVLQPNVAAILNVVLGKDGAQDTYFKVSSQSLRCLTIITTMLAESPDQGAVTGQVQQIFDAVSQRFVAQDIDQEVKECAIDAMCTLMAHFGQSSLQGKLNGVQEVLVERLGNEPTRMPAVQGIGYLASHEIDLGHTVEAAMKLFVEFFRKKHAAVKQASLVATEVVIRSKNVAHLPEPTVLELVQGISPLISDTDLFQAHLAIKVGIGLSDSAIPEITQMLMDHVLPSLLQLLQSPLLQGMALQSLLTFFKQLIEKGLAFEPLVLQVCDILKSAGASALPKTAISSIAKVVGTLCAAASQSDAQATVVAFVKDTQDGSVSDLHRAFALHAIGEIGRLIPLSEQGLDRTIASCLESSRGEDIKSAASYALGCICVGNAAQYFGTVLAEIEQTKEKKYLLIQSVKEWISQAIADNKSELVAPYMEQLLKLLFALNADEEEGVRNISGECLGKLALASPSTIIPMMLERAQGDNSVLTAAIVTALRFTVWHAGAEADQVLGPLLQGFLQLLDHSEIAVRKPLLHTVNTIALNKPRFVREAQPVSGASLLTIVYRETVPNPDHLRVKQIGCFKHKVDDGLELRMAAYECLDTLFDTCIDRIDPNELVVHLVGGLKDDIDVKMLCQLMLLKVVELFQDAAMAQLEDLCAALLKTVQTNTKSDAVPTEIKRNQDCHASALRAILALRAIDESAKPMVDMIATLKSNEKTAPR